MHTTIPSSPRQKHRALFRIACGLLASLLLTACPPPQPPGTLEHQASVSGSVATIALQPDEKILVGGEFPSIAMRSVFNVARLVGVEAESDALFQVGAGAGGYPNTVFAIAVQRDGKILIGGNFGHIAGIPRPYFGRLNANGSPDTAFNSSLPPFASTVTAIAIQTDGKILVALVTGAPVRLHTNGSLDPTFTSAVSNAGCTAVQQDGKILVGGDFSTSGAATRHNIARLEADGSLDATFDAGLDGTPNERVDCIAFTKGGEILIGGSFHTVGGQPQQAFARLTPTGALLASAFSQTFDPNPSISDIAVQSDGKIIIGGKFSILNTDRSNVVRLHPDGSRDLAFVAPASLPPIGAVALAKNGEVLAGKRDFAFSSALSGLGWLSNEPASYILTSPASSQAELLASGGAPFFTEVHFEFSSDNST